MGRGDALPQIAQNDLRLLIVSVVSLQNGKKKKIIKGVVHHWKDFILLGVPSPSPPGRLLRCAGWKGMETPTTGSTFPSIPVSTRPGAPPVCLVCLCEGKPGVLAAFPSPRKRGRGGCTPAAPAPLRAWSPHSGEALGEERWGKPSLAAKELPQPRGSVPRAHPGLSPLQVAPPALLQHLQAHGLPLPWR